MRSFFFRQWALLCIGASLAASAGAAEEARVLCREEVIGHVGGEPIFLSEWKAFLDEAGRSPDKEALRQKVEAYMFHKAAVAYMRVQSRSSLPSIPVPDDVIRHRFKESWDSLSKADRETLLYQLGMTCQEVQKCLYRTMYDEYLVVLFMNHLSRFDSLSPDEVMAVVGSKSIQQSGYDPSIHYALIAEEAQCRYQEVQCKKWQASQKKLMHIFHEHCHDVITDSFRTLFGEEADQRGASHLQL